MQATQQAHKGPASTRTSMHSPALPALKQRCMCPLLHDHCCLPPPPQPASQSITKPQAFDSPMSFGADVEAQSTFQQLGWGHLGLRRPLPATFRGRHLLPALGRGHPVGGRLPPGGWPVDVHGICHRLQRDLRGACIAAVSMESLGCHGESWMS